MPGGPTALGAQLQLDYITGRALGYTAARNVYLALLTSAPLDNAGLSSLPEVTTAGYSRQQITWTPATLAKPSQSSNAGVVTFGPVSADMSTPVTHAALVTPQVGTTGDVLYTWALDVSQQAVNGQALQIAIGKLTMSQS
ncbi:MULTISPECIES: phage tail fiber protein [Nonomuraea]|uniref:phage tail fiber protein n=1 Tax=Nonomuraea TaxID=83681 RepID=UPI0012F9AFE4|nr:hypothetical protein [Nonomuraea typhae]